MVLTSHKFRTLGRLDASDDKRLFFTKPYFVGDHFDFKPDIDGYFSTDSLSYSDTPFPVAKTNQGFAAQ